MLPFSRDCTIEQSLQRRTLRRVHGRHTITLPKSGEVTEMQRTVARSKKTIISSPLDLLYDTTDNARNYPKKVQPKHWHANRSLAILGTQR